MSKLLKNLWMLQIFAEGGDGGAGEGAGVSAEGAQAAAAGQPSGESAASAQAAAAGQQESFGDLIAGRYKADFERETSKIVRARVREAQQENKTLRESNDAWSEIGKFLQARYGQPDRQLTAQELLENVRADNYYVELEADKNGITPEAQRQIMRQRWGQEEEHEELMRLRQEQQDREYFTKLIREEATVREKYPDFDVRTELANPMFMQLTKSGLSAGEAYEMLHHRELVEAAEKKAAEEARKMTAASVASGAGRVSENGLGTAAPTVQKADPSKFSREKMERIRRAAMAGESIGPGHPLWEN